MADEIRGRLHTLASERYVPAYDFAIASLGLGEIDAALDAFDAAVEERSGWVAYLDVEPRLDPLRPPLQRWVRSGSRQRTSRRAATDWHHSAGFE